MYKCLHQTRRYPFTVGRFMMDSAACVDRQDNYIAVGGSSDGARMV